jgi:hypothetical protein
MPWPAGEVTRKVCLLKDRGEPRALLHAVVRLAVRGSARLG